MKPNRTYVGIDIGKERLDVSTPAKEFETSNNAAGFANLLGTVSKECNSPHFVFENTSYSRRLAIFLASKGYPYCAVHAYSARQFAKATGRIAKTDRIDSRGLAKYAETLKIEPTVPPDKTERLLLHLSRRRGQLVKHLQVIKTQHLQLWDASVRGSSKRLIVFVETEIRLLDKRLKSIVTKTKGMADLVAALSGVVGIGENTAIRLISEMPELGRLNRKKVAALTGLAPLNDDSATKVGRRRIFGGRKHIRHLLYMPVVVGVTRNPVLSDFYKALRSRGKSHAVALTASMRKLVIYLNHLARQRKADGAVPLQIVKRLGRRPWSEDDHINLKRLIAEKLSSKQIGAKMGRTEIAIDGMCAKLSLKRGALSC